MEKLVKSYQSAESRGEEPISLIAATILDFLCIHPFPDGNGRMARLISTWLLYRNGFGVQRYISLERLIEDRKDDYYHALRKSDSGWHSNQHKIEPWVEFFAKLTLDAYEIWNKKFQALSISKPKKRDLVRLEVQRLRTFTFSSICAGIPDISSETVRLELTKMKKEGLIISHGHGRGASWAVVDPLQ